MPRSFPGLSLRPFNPLRWKRFNQVTLVVYVVLGAGLFSTFNRFLLARQFHWLAALLIGAVFGVIVSYFEIAQNEAETPPPIDFD